MEKIIFVYNANSGLFNTISDYTHKIISPKTYACTLCKLSYGNLGMKKKWKSFLESLNLKIEFLHKDEFKKKYPKNIQKLPCILKVGDTKEILLVSAKELNSCTTLEEMITLLNIKLKKNHT